MIITFLIIIQEYMGREWHVSKKGSDKANGSLEAPFLTISKAANLALAGDRVIVHEGIYREDVDPRHGGIDTNNRIVYEAAESEKVIVAGTEIVKNWEKLKDSTVWKLTLENSFFGDYNPYVQRVFGDWFVAPLDIILHTGEVYLNGKSFYEGKDLDEVKSPQKRTHGVNPPWTKRLEEIRNPEDTLYRWCCEVDGENTYIYANFHDFDPNKEKVEINVRKHCFYPTKTGRDYITVRGFEMYGAATPWTPPTADQPGLLGANWSKGWIIENNIIHDSKCSGISLGKEGLTGDNWSTKYHRKPGYQYQMEAVFKAYNSGWSKEKIGSHIVRNNIIYDCGQNGIVGHMGCIFSEIYHNHIYNIATKHEFFGYEIAGIKLHAAIDVVIENNYIHDTTLGIWLDWQDQGTRVSRNVLHNNDRDIMIEVTHGPHLVDNNIFGSDYSFDNIAQGGAYINNLFCGSMRREPVLDRATPYHLPHSTKLAGVTFVYGGDDRWYQNIFVGGVKTYTEQSICGLSDYDDSPVSLEDYAEIIKSIEGDHEAFGSTKDPVYIDRNLYLNGAKPFNKEKEKIEISYDPCIKIEMVDKKVYLDVDVPEEIHSIKNIIINTGKVPLTRISECAIENAYGGEIIIDKDIRGEVREKSNDNIGPVTALNHGKQRVCVWSV